MVASEDNIKLPCVVADSAAFLRNVDLQNIGEQIFTIKEVVHEIRDSATKQRLAVLPYQLHFREPSTQSLQIVQDFAKKTGDYKALSVVDLKVLALTHQLEKEFCSVDHIKLEPSKKTAIVHKARVLSDKEIAGFYLEPKVVNVDGASDVENEKGAVISDTVVEDTIEEGSEEQECVEMIEHGEKEQICHQDNHDSDNTDGKDDSPDGDCGKTEGDNNDGSDDGAEDCDDGGDDGGEDDDDGGGWITPGNIKEVKQTFGTDDEIKIEESNIKCACLTTDFAMQNVLIQMGLHVVSTHGMLIRQARNYIQKCFGCYKETHDMTRIFCPSCGNKTLNKVSVSIGEDGTMQYYYPKHKRNPNIRGTKFSIPAPKQGRLATQILLVEDQPMGQNRMPRSRDKTSPLDPDYVGRTNPFAVNDVNSRAFYLGLHVKNKQARNPNESKKKKSGRKK